MKTEKNPKIQRIRLKIGDVIEIPLPSGKKGFIQYIYPDWWGDLIGIYDYVANKNEEVDLDKLKKAKFKFYPILTRVKQGIKFSEAFSQVDKINKSIIKLSETFLKMASDKTTNYNWKIIGNIKVENFVYPNFIWKEGAMLAKDRTTKWYLFNGKQNIDLGKRLPKEYKNLEYQSNIPSEAIIDLIMDKKNRDREIAIETIKRG